MKFGKRLHRAAMSFTDPAYALHLLDYKALKKLIKRLTAHRSYHQQHHHGSHHLTPSHAASIANTSPSLSPSSSSPVLSSRSLPHDELSKQLAASSITTTHTPAPSDDSSHTAASSSTSASFTSASSSASTSSPSLSITIPPSISHTSLHRVHSSPDSALSTPSPSPSSAHPFSPPLDDLPPHVDSPALAMEFMRALEKELLKVNSFYQHVVSSLQLQVVALRAVLPRDGDLSCLSDVCEGMSQLRKFIVLNYLGVIKIVKKHDKNAGQPVAEQMIPYLYAQPFYHSLQVAQMYTEVDNMSRMGMKSVRRDDFNCPICGDLLECPVVLSCSHRFCWKCISRAANSSGTGEDACPVCLKPQLLDPSNYIVDDLLLQFIRNNFPKKGGNAQPPPTSSSPFNKVTEVVSPKFEATQLVVVRRGSREEERREHTDDVTAHQQSSSTSPPSTASALYSAAVVASLSTFTTSPSTSMMSPPPSFLFSPPSFLRSHSPSEDTASSFASSSSSGPFQPSQRQTAFDAARGGEQPSHHLDPPMQHPQTSGADHFHHDFSPFLLSSHTPSLSPSPAPPTEFHLDASHSHSHSPPQHSRLSTRPWQTHAGTGDKFLLPWLPEDQEDEDVCADVQHEPVNLGYHWPTFNDFVEEDNQQQLERQQVMSHFQSQPPRQQLQQQLHAVLHRQQALQAQGADEYAMQDEDERLHPASTSPQSSSSSPSSEHSSLSSSDMLALTSMNHLFMNEDHSQDVAGNHASDMAMSPSTTFLTPTQPDLSLLPSPSQPATDSVADHMSQLQANLAEAMRQQLGKPALAIPPITLPSHSPPYHGQQPLGGGGGGEKPQSSGHARSGSFHSTHSESSNSSQASHSPGGHHSHRGPKTAMHGGEEERPSSGGFSEPGMHPAAAHDEGHSGRFASQSEYARYRGSASSAPSSSPSPLSGHFSPPSQSRRAMPMQPPVAPSSSGGSSGPNLPSPSLRGFHIPANGSQQQPSQSPTEHSQSRSLLHQKYSLAIATTNGQPAPSPFSYSSSTPSSPLHPTPPSAYHPPHHVYSVPNGGASHHHNPNSGLSSPRSASSSSSSMRENSHPPFHTAHMQPGPSNVEQQQQPQSQHVMPGPGGYPVLSDGHIAHSEPAPRVGRASSFSSVASLPSPQTAAVQQPSGSHPPPHSLDGFSGHPGPLHIQIPQASGHSSLISSHPHLSPNAPHTQHHSNGTTTVWVPIQVSNMQATPVQGGGTVPGLDGGSEEGEEKAESAHPLTLLQMSNQSPVHSSSPSPSNAPSGSTTPNGGQPNSLTAAHVLNRPTSAFLRKMPRFLCQHPGCCDGFNTRFSLKRHLKMHTGEKPYPCTQCPKSFAEKSTLVRHLRIHTGERPFACSWQGCDRSFSDRTNVKRHEQQHELQKDLPLEEQTAMMSEQAEKEVLKRREAEAQQRKRADWAEEAAAGSALDDEGVQMHETGEKAIMVKHEEQQGKEVHTELERLEEDENKGAGPGVFMMQSHG